MRTKREQLDELRRPPVGGHQAHVGRVAGKTGHVVLEPVKEAYLVPDGVVGARQRARAAAAAASRVAARAARLCSLAGAAIEVRQKSCCKLAKRLVESLREKELAKSKRRIARASIGQASD